MAPQNRARQLDPSLRMRTAVVRDAVNLQPAASMRVPPIILFTSLYVCNCSAALPSRRCVVSGALRGGCATVGSVRSLLRRRRLLCVPSISFPLPPLSSPPLASPRLAVTHATDPLAAPGGRAANPIRARHTHCASNAAQWTSEHRERTGGLARHNTTTRSGEQIHARVAALRCAADCCPDSAFVWLCTDRSQLPTAAPYETRCSQFGGNDNRSLGVSQTCAQRSQTQEPSAASSSVAAERGELAAASESSAAASASSRVPAAACPPSKRARHSTAASRSRQAEERDDTAQQQTAHARTRMADSSPASSLCADEWLSVFAFLPAASLLSLARTCTQLAAHATQPAAWKHAHTIRVNSQSLVESEGHTGDTAPSAAVSSASASASSVPAAPVRASRLRCSSFAPVALQLRSIDVSVPAWLRRVVSLSVHWSIDPSNIPPASLARVVDLQVRGRHVLGSDGVERLMQLIPALHSVTVSFHGVRLQQVEAEMRAIGSDAVLKAAALSVTPTFTHSNVRRLHLHVCDFGYSDSPHDATLARCHRLINAFPSLTQLSLSSRAQGTDNLLTRIAPALLSRPVPPRLRLSIDCGDIVDGHAAFQPDLMAPWVDEYEAAASAQAARHMAAGRTPHAPLPFDLLLVEEPDNQTHSFHVEALLSFVEALRPDAQFIRTRFLVAPSTRGIDDIDYSEPAVPYKLRRDECDPDEPYDPRFAPFYESKQE